MKCEEHNIEKDYTQSGKCPLCALLETETQERLKKMIDEEARGLNDKMYHAMHPFINK